MQSPETQAVLDRGDAAARLLEDPSFVSVMNELSSAHLHAMLHSALGPVGREAREHHHRMTHALLEITDALKGRADAAENLRDRIEQNAADEGYEPPAALNEDEHE